MMNDEPNPGGLVGRAWSYIRQAWLVILLALLYGAALAGVQSTLSPRILQNKENETYDRIPDLVPGADRDRTARLNTTETFEIEGADGKPRRVYKAVAEDGSVKGWVLPVSGLGFADRIDLLVGLDRDVTTISGLYVLDQKETPGLGDNITKPAFRDHFKDQPADRPLTVVKPTDRADPQARVDYEIVAVTGATISSQSVARIVNDAIANCREPLRRLAGATPQTQPAEDQSPEKDLD